MNGDPQAAGYAHDPVPEWHRSLAGSVFAILRGLRYELNSRVAVRADDPVAVESSGLPDSHRKQVRPRFP